MLYDELKRLPMKEIKKQLSEAKNMCRMYENMKPLYGAQLINYRKNKYKIAVCNHILQGGGNMDKVIFKKNGAEVFTTFADVVNWFDVGLVNVNFPADIEADEALQCFAAGWSTEQADFLTKSFEGLNIQFSDILGCYCLLVNFCGISWGLVPVRVTDEKVENAILKFGVEKEF